jgi:hypothetical protein
MATQIRTFNILKQLVWVAAAVFLWAGQAQAQALGTPADLVVGGTLQLKGVDTKGCLLYTSDAADDM